jgi:sucrose phosphorylase
MQIDNNNGPEKSRRFTKTRHTPEPDYSRPLLNISAETRERVLAHLRFLYGGPAAGAHLLELERILKVYYAHKPPEMIEQEKVFDPIERFTEEDMVLITYGDLIRGERGTPLATLAEMCETYLRAINTIHILPFFPYSSDKGFSVVDFKSVDSRLGTWDDVGVLESRYQLMFDGVFNHISSRHEYFREFLNGSPEYQDFFIAYDSQDDLTAEQRTLIFRPRTSEILSRFQSITGPKFVWTTFSKDQIDLNYKNPKVLIAIVELLLFYVRQGADIIRLDAVPYFWAEPGTKSVHLAQTHEIVRLLRTVLETVAPYVALVTETNVRHFLNVSYFGNGHDEAHMVYNFALPPLVLHSFYTEDVSTLSDWAKSLITPSETTTFFNILDTHDGIGLMAAKDILSSEEIAVLIQRARDHGAFVSYKTDADGGEEPYELNTTWWSALNRDDSGEDLVLRVKRFVASRSISYVLRGVPGIYIHGSLGTSNDNNIVGTAKEKRDINRQLIDKNTIAEAAKDPNSKLYLIGSHLRRINLCRVEQRAFHPRGSQQVLMTSPAVFSVLRTSPEGDEHVLALTNVSNRVVEIEITLSDLGLDQGHWRDLLSGKEKKAEGRRLFLTLQPYDVLWLKPSE